MASVGSSPVDSCDPLTIVLLPGWAMSAEVWSEVLPDLPSDTRRLVLEWSDEDVAGGLPALLDQWRDRVQGPAIWMGWSLGGQLALAMAERHPSMVRGLVLASSNLLFVATEAWPIAMSAEYFSSFRSMVEKVPQQALEQFAFLQCQGSRSVRGDIRRLRAYIRGELSSETLLASLSWLESLDVRAAWEGVSCPVMWIGGRYDELVPSQVAALMQALQPRATIEVLDASHVPFFSATEEVKRLLTSFLANIRGVDDV